jgi:hypothetical protein
LLRLFNFILYSRQQAAGVHSPSKTKQNKTKQNKLKTKILPISQFPHVKMPSIDDLTDGLHSIMDSTETITQFKDVLHGRPPQIPLAGRHVYCAYDRGMRFWTTDWRVADALGLYT